MPRLLRQKSEDSADAVLRHGRQRQARDRKKLRDAAGIAGAQAAKAYKGHILAAGIEDDKRNFTRFFLVRKTRRVLPGANKTSIAFSVKNIAGALFKALAVFALRDISLTKIESRPLRGRPWEYVFYADFLRGDDEPAATLCATSARWPIW